MFSSLSKKSIVLSTAVVLSLGLVGCGGSDSGATTSATKTGVFVDAPVQGLSYKTASQNGFTDAQGHFQYKDGETVEFKLGTLSLGKGKAEALVTPYTISDNNTTATNIAMVLQNFDGNKNNSQILDLTKLKDFNFSSDDININASSSDFNNEVATLLATASFQNLIDSTNLTLITETEAKNAMDDYINSNIIAHPTSTTPTNIDSTPTTNGNIVPYTQKFSSTSPEGYEYTQEVGAIGQLQAKSIEYNGKQYGLELKLLDNVTSINLISAIAATNMEGDNKQAGHYSGSSTSDFKAGTEHLVISSDKYGSADCINTYNTILPYMLTDENNLDGMYFDKVNLISSTCPSWVTEDDNSTQPENFKSTTNYTLEDSNGNITKASNFRQIVLH